MIELNKKIKNFKLPNQDGEEIELKNFLGKKVLVYFYPKDNTPGCTIEAKCFRDRLNDLSALNLQVIGISADDINSHKKFVTKHGLNFPLLADVEHKVSEQFGVWKEKNFMGKKFFGVSRESFLIDEKGFLIKHYRKVNPSEHVKEIIDDLKKEVEL